MIFTVFNGDVGDYDAGGRTWTYWKYFQHHCASQVDNLVVMIVLARQVQVDYHNFATSVVYLKINTI